MVHVCAPPGTALASDAGSAPGAPSRTLAALAFGNFAVGTGSFVVVGVLAPLARDLGLSLPAAGQMVTAYALAYAVASPLLVALTGRVRRKRVLLGGLVVLAMAGVLAALAQGPAALFASRVLMACGAAVFTPTAAAIAAATTDGAHRGRALSLVFLGLSLAQVLGIPLGTYIGLELGWRAALLAGAALAAAAVVGVLLGVPDEVETPRVSLADWTGALRDWRLVAGLAVMALQTAAQYAVYAYAGPVVSHLTGLGGLGVTLMLLVFGVAAVGGAVLGGWASDRAGPGRTLTASLVALTVVLCALPLVQGTVATGVLFAAWGVAGFMFMAPQQARLVGMAPGAQGALLALNASSLYVGGAAGSALGGLVFATAGIPWLGAAGAVLAALALVALAVSNRPKAKLAGVPSGPAARSFGSKALTERIAPAQAMQPPAASRPARLRAPFRRSRGYPGPLRRGRAGRAAASAARLARDLVCLAQGAAAACSLPCRDRAGHAGVRRLLARACRIREAPGRPRPARPRPAAWPRPRTPGRPRHGRGRGLRLRGPVRERGAPPGAGRGDVARLRRGGPQGCSRLAHGIRDGTRVVRRR